MSSTLVAGSENDGWTLDAAFTPLSVCIGYTLDSDADGSQVTIHLGPLHLTYWKARRTVVAPNCNHLSSDEELKPHD